ncbi:MAG: SusD family outer membrane lipoprotein NanU [Bacteroidetes bacterium]|nr:SusD family outer membrane lipoprotein NanU [Bacteroidota bacterium]
MKKLIILLIIAANLIFLGACNKMTLDLAPDSSITDGNFWKSPEQFNSFIIGIHSRFRTHAYNFFVMGELRSDIYGDSPFGGEATQGVERFWFNTLNSENVGISNYGGFYQNINQINLFISKTLSTSVLTSADKNYYLGQAYGLRAFYYFQMMKTWGKVIIQTVPSQSFDLNNLAKASSSTTDVMALVKKDIDSSTVHFSNDYTFKETKSLWSKAATLMLKSEAYLWSSKQMGGGVADATIAKAALTEVQTNIPTLSLMPNFKDVFAYAQKGNKEIIFAVRDQLNEYDLFGGNFAGTFLPQGSYLGNFYDSIAATKINTSVENLAGLLRAPVKINTFWRFSNADTRKLGTMKGAYNLIGGKYVLAGCYLYKYQGVNDGGSRKIVDDYPIYRYADLLLMLAEAKNILGEDPTTEINLVRQRAYGSNYSAAKYGFPNQTGDNIVADAILKERFFEFLGEGKRWYDLLRYGKNYVVKYTTVTQDYQLLWPIDKTTLTNNKLLIQTPGY